MISGVYRFLGSVITMMLSVFRLNVSTWLMHGTSMVHMNSKIQMCLDRDDFGCAQVFGVGEHDGVISFKARRRYVAHAWHMHYAHELENSNVLRSK